MTEHALTETQILSQLDTGRSVRGFFAVDYTVVVSRAEPDDSGFGPVYNICFYKKHKLPPFALCRVYGVDELFRNLRDIADDWYISEKENSDD